MTNKYLTNESEEETQNNQEKWMISINQNQKVNSLKSQKPIKKSSYKNNLHSENSGHR